MEKDDIIRRIKAQCGHNLSGESAYSDHDFLIHQKDRGSFTVRRGNHLDWSDGRTLLIIFTKFKPSQAIKKASEQDSFLNKALTLIMTGAGEIQKNREELENAKQVRIPWRNITGIGQR